MNKIKEKAKTVKQNIKQNNYIGSLGSYLLYYFSLFNPVGSADSKKEVNYVWSGSQAEYDSLTPQDDTLYFIEEEEG